MKKELHPKERRAVIKATGKEVIVYPSSTHAKTWISSKDFLTTYMESELQFL